MQEPRSTAFSGMSRSRRPVEEGEDEETESAVVVAGGFNSQQGHLNSTEIYSPLEDTWRYGGPLPVSVRGGMSVQLNSSFLAVGGVMSNGSFSNAVYLFNETAETWSDSGIRLATPRAYAIAFMVPDEALNCS